MIEATLRVRLPCAWVTLLTERLGTALNVLEQKPIGNGKLQSLVEIDPKGTDTATILDALRGTPDVTDVQAIVPERGKILATVQVRDCHACQVLADSECFLTDAAATEGGGIEWHLLAPNRGAVKDLVSLLRRRGLEPNIAIIRTAKSAGVLTGRQDAVLRLAYKLGYFEYPKRVNLTKLAERLGVAKSTLSEILRAGEGKILHSYFHGQIGKGR